ncbi:MAG: flagellar biosynthetic protein FliO [Proteobacteria bacterium]|nr:flagellar biosynthetic protein FliO [Pseudomonadota bacterium]
MGKGVDKTIMNIRQPSSTQAPSCGKTLIALGVSLLFYLSCPLILFAAEQFGGGTGAGVPSIPAGLTGNQETLSLTTTIFKTLGSLIIVVGLMLILLLWIRKMGFAGTSSGQTNLITVIDSQMLAPKKQVSVLEVAGTYLVVGLSEQQITLLTTLDANDALKNATHSRKTFTPLPPSFASLLSKAAQGISSVKQKKEGSANAE